MPKNPPKWESSLRERINKTNLAAEPREISINKPEPDRARTLPEWENYLLPFIARARLLGEIPLRQDEFNSIVDQIRAVIDGASNLHEATRRIVKRAPLTFVTFLAHFAAHNTKREFWEALGELIGASASDLTNANWRRIFIDILEDNDKPTFEDVGGATNKYVTAMRVHGGIPAYSLNDFFANMLLPSIEKPEYIPLKGTELRDALLRRSSVQTFTDSIVHNFFENTGEIGLKFLETCQCMALHYQKEQLILSGLDLPAYVTEAFVNFMEGQQDEHVRLKRPRLLFDDSEGILLDLPEQPLSGVVISTTREAFWHIETDEDTKGRDERVRIGKQGRDNITEGRKIPLHPVSHVHISFHLQGDETIHPQQLRRWTFTLIPADNAPPLLIFRRQDSSLVRWVQSLPAAELLLLYPRDVLLEPDGSSRILHKPDSLSGSWRTWRAEYWTLEAGFLRLTRNEQEIALIPIQGRAAIPQLVGAEPFASNIDPKGVPLFVGELPRLRIPIRASRFEDRKLWNIELSSVWEASPQIRTETSLDKLTEHIQEEEEYLEVDLRTLLGKAPTGTYDLRVCNRLDIDVEFRLRLWESLQLRDLPEIIFPSARTTQEPSPIKFSLTLPVSTSCEPQAGAAGITVTGQYGRYSVNVEEGVTRADLQLVKAQNGQLIQIPLFVPIPRLEWRLVLGDELAVAWTTRSIKRSIDTFLQAEQAMPVSLLVRLHNIEHIAKQMAVYLVDSNHPERVLQSDFKLELSPLGEGHIRFTLGAHDTLRGHPELSVFEFQLGIPDPNTWIETRVPLLTLTRALEISHVRPETIDNALILHWDDARPLNNRRMYIRSPWQPWEKGWDIKIPDSVRDEFDFLSAGYALPPSRYEIYFYVAPDWEPVRTAPPHQTCDVIDTVNPNAHLAWLADRIQKDPNHAFHWYFESACVFESLGDQHKRDEAINLSFKMLDQASLTHVLAFHDWLENYDSSTQKAVRMKLYRPERLARLFSDTKRTDSFRYRYLQHITSIKSISPETALILIRSTDDPLVVMHSLSSLIKAHSSESVESIIALLRKGQLSDSDATDLLLLEMDFSFGVLDTSAPTPEHLRQLSALIQRREDKTTLVANLSTDKLVALATAENNIGAVKFYLAQLIQEAEQRGLVQVMLMFQQGRLRGEEVTELLGNNPRFSYDVLAHAPTQHAHQIQLTELSRKYPGATGFVAPGMFVSTPAGWGLIESIQDIQGNKLEFVSSEEPVIYILSLHAQTSPEPALLNMNLRVLIFPAAKEVMKCSKCATFITGDIRNFKEHYHLLHDGIGFSFSPQPPRIPVINIPEFRENIQ